MIFDLFVSESEGMQMPEHFKVSASKKKQVILSMDQDLVEKIECLNQGL